MDKVLKEIAKAIKTNDKKIIIGISGHGASGKTTFTTKLIEKLDQKEVNYLNTDPYIIGSNLRQYTTVDYEYRNQTHHYKMTACHPAAHNVSALERDIKMLRDGLDYYSIGTHYQDSTLIDSRNNLHIMEGMSVAFVHLGLFDISIYLYTDGEIEYSRRTVRDVSERGTDLNYLKQSHEERRIQYDLFMHPYHQNFDIVIKNSNEGFSIEKNNLYI